MSFLEIYYYTSLPILTCNLLFYSIANLSTSITSSQNVIKFVSEHSYSDTIVFEKHVTNNDLLNKLLIIKSLINDVITKFCNNDKYIMDTIHSQQINTSFLEYEDYLVVPKNDLSFNIAEPIKLSIISTSRVIFQITDLFEKVKKKIEYYNTSIKRHFTSIQLKEEIDELNGLIQLLEIRTNLLIDILKLYLHK